MGTILFTNSKVWSPDGKFAESFGIKDGVFNFVGSNEDARLKRNEYYKTVDLKGRLVLPGLTDGHLHLCYGSLMRKRLNCREVKSKAELTKQINKYDSTIKNGNWIIGSNLDMLQVIGSASGAPGNVADEMYSKKPLFIANYDYHSAICNTLALEKSGLLKELNAFSDEKAPRDSNGNLTGIIKEEALDYVFERLPEPSIEEKARAVIEFIKILHSYGITTVTDITLPQDLDVYNYLHDKGKLSIRINSYVPFEEFQNLPEFEEQTRDLDHDYFSINGFKAFYDGALGSTSALFSENYLGTNSKGCRTDMAESGELKELALAIDESKKQMIIHAIGDKAVSEVLDIFEELKKKNGERERRLRIEHAQHIREEDFDRFKLNNVIVSAQPVHLKYDIGIVRQRLPENLVNTTHNYKALIDKGVMVNFGTDFPIADVNPFENIYMAVSRKTDAETFTPEYKIGLHDCIKAYTINNAYSNFNDNATGSIETGKVADFVIMKDDLFEMKEDKLNQAKVYKTYLNGEEVYKG